MSENPLISRRGLLFILSSPSGAGKTSLAKEMLLHDKNLISSISVTTRPSRASEVHGRDYYFISREEYDAMIADQRLLEHVEVFGNGYGTPKQFVLSTLSQGKDIIFDIDWQGTQQLAAAMCSDLVTIFILPPSLQALGNRLRGRAEDSPKVLEERFADAEKTMSHWPEYDYVLVNTDFNKTVEQIGSILTAERLKRIRQVGLRDFVKSLMPES